jgi:hypothetical protein
VVAHLVEGREGALNQIQYWKRWTQMAMKKFLPKKLKTQLRHSKAWTRTVTAKFLKQTWVDAVVAVGSATDKEVVRLKVDSKAAEGPAVLLKVAADLVEVCVPTKETAGCHPKRQRLS